MRDAVLLHYSSQGYLLQKSIWVYRRRYARSLEDIQVRGERRKHISNIIASQNTKELERLLHAFLCPPIGIIVSPSTVYRIRRIRLYREAYESNDNSRRNENSWFSNPLRVSTRSDFLSSSFLASFPINRNPLMPKPQMKCFCPTSKLTSVSNTCFWLRLGVCTCIFVC